MPGFKASNVYNHLSIVHRIGQNHKHKKFYAMANQKWFYFGISGHGIILERILFLIIVKCVRLILFQVVSDFVR